MQDNQLDRDAVHDLMVESSSRRRGDRPKKLQSLIDTQAMRFLEAADFQSFGNLASACEKFMIEAPGFQSSSSFAAAALALDLTARLFATIDRDRNKLLSRDEFAYWLEATTAANREALSWLVENFNAFTQACFFKDQIGRDDIEAARNVFHGLKIAQQEFGFSKTPTMENLRELDEDKIRDYLDRQKDSLSPNEACGLKYLLDHLQKHVGGGEKGALQERKQPGADDRLRALAGVLDRRSLQTLKALRLTSFESLFQAFAELLTDDLSVAGDLPFDKASAALDGCAGILGELEMGDEHLFTAGELLIVSRLTGGKQKKQAGWLAKCFEGFTRAFSFGRGARQKDIQTAGYIFHGLGLVSRRFNCGEEVYPQFKQQLRRHIKTFLSMQQNSLSGPDRHGLEELVRFMERHAV
jgi:hypothetical protein